LSKKDEGLNKLKKRGLPFFGFGINFSHLQALISFTLHISSLYIAEMADIGEGKLLGFGDTGDAILSSFMKLEINQIKLAAEFRSVLLDVGLITNETTHDEFVSINGMMEHLTDKLVLGLSARVGVSHSPLGLGHISHFDLYANYRPNALLDAKAIELKLTAEELSTLKTNRTKLVKSVGSARYSFTWLIHLFFNHV
jgi:hypothetical protein